MGMLMQQAYDEILRRADLAVSNVAVELFDDIVRSINTLGPPRSDPGNPPNIDTSNLISNFVLDGGEGMYKISSPDNYAWFLEFGTYRMEPRPYLTPAILRATVSAETWAKAGMTKQQVTMPHYWDGVVS